MPSQIPPNDGDDIPHTRQEPRPDFSKPIARKRLPDSLQKTLDSEESTWAVLYDGSAPESTDTNLRYAAYASRFRTILLSAQRYVAYTSDIGESFRPVAHPNWVRAAYGISWLYLGGDVGYEGYSEYFPRDSLTSFDTYQNSYHLEALHGLRHTAKAYLRNLRIKYPELQEGAAEQVTAGGVPKSEVGVTAKLGESAQDTNALVAATPGHVPAIEDWRSVMVQRAVFQSVASMGLPAFTIHSIVRYSGQALKKQKNVRIRTWGPIGLGLAAVPALPFIFDTPVEVATEWIFHKAFEAVGGPEAVGHRPVTGDNKLRQAESKAGAAREKEKEL